MREDVIQKALSSHLTGEKVRDILTPSELAEFAARAKAAMEAVGRQRAMVHEEAEKARRLAEIEAGERFRKTVPRGIAALVKHASENIANDLAHMALAPNPVPVVYNFPFKGLDRILNDYGGNEIREVYEWLYIEPSTAAFARKYWTPPASGTAAAKMNLRDEESFSRALSERSFGVGCVDFDEFVSLCSTFGYRYAFFIGSEYHPKYWDSDDRRDRGDYWTNKFELRISA